MKVDFIIVGVMKSGTTTLAHHFFKHPDIAIPEKEVHFFDYDEKYKMGIEWYETIFDSCKPAAKIAGEKTPYSFYPYTAERIYKYNPGIKLIWIFRNPVDRAFSNYTHDLYNIDEFRSFEACIKKEQSREVLYQYLSKGRYIEQVENYLRFFPKEQMHFVLFEEFLLNPVKELNFLFDFLNVSKDKFTFEKELHSKISKYPAINPALLFFYKKYFGNKGVLWNYLWRKSFSGGDKPAMKSHTRKKLLEYYSPYNKKLAELILKNTTIWNN